MRCATACAPSPGLARRRGRRAPPAGSCPRAARGHPAAWLTARHSCCARRASSKVSRDGNTRREGELTRGSAVDLLCPRSATADDLTVRLYRDSGLLALAAQDGRRRCGLAVRRGYNNSFDFRSGGHAARAPTTVARSRLSVLLRGSVRNRTRAERLSLKDWDFAPESDCAAARAPGRAREARPRSGIHARRSAVKPRPCLPLLRPRRSRWLGGLPAPRSSVASKCRRGRAADAEAQWAAAAAVPQIPRPV